MNSSLIEAGNRHVGKPRAGQYTQQWFTLEIKMRNANRRTTKDNWPEYLDVCSGTRKLLEEARHKKCEEFLADLENKPDQPARRWSEHLQQWSRNPYYTKDHNCTTSIFMKVYAAVNSFHVNKEERKCIRQIESTLKSPIVEESWCAALRRK